MVAEAEEIGGRRRDGSRASELVRVLVVEEEDGGGPPGQAARCWMARARLTQAGPRGEGALGREDVEGGGEGGGARLGDDEGGGPRLGDGEGGGARLGGDERGGQRVRSMRQGRD